MKLLPVTEERNRLYRNAPCIVPFLVPVLAGNFFSMISERKVAASVLAR